MLDGVTKEVNILLWIVTFQLASRGADYFTGNPRPGIGAFEIGAYTPAFVWGVTCLATAAVVLVGLFVKSRRVTRDGAVLAMCVYLAFSVVVVDDVFRDGFDDWRILTGYLAAAATWGVLAGSLTLSMAVADNRKGGADGDRRSCRTARND